MNKNKQKILDAFSSKYKTYDQYSIVQKEVSMRMMERLKSIKSSPKNILDIGCGGGLLCEPMVRLGATVTGVDAAARNIPVAQAHADQSNLQIEYIAGTAESLVAQGRVFDAVLNMEVVEHVADPQGYLKACQELLRPGGLMVCSTINRNAKSFAMAIVGAEYVMRWLPKGTHAWSKFITPDELSVFIETAGLSVVDRKGFVFNPLSWQWRLSDRDLSVNYVTASVKP